MKTVMSCVCLVLLATFTGCPTTPDSVHTQMDKTIVFERSLAQAHADDLQRFSTFTLELEKYVDEAHKIIIERDQRVRELLMFHLRSRSEKLKLEEMASFDRKAWKLLTVEFVEQLNATLMSEANEIVEKYEAERDGIKNGQYADDPKNVKRLKEIETQIPNVMYRTMIIVFDLQEKLIKEIERARKSVEVEIDRILEEKLNKYLKSDEAGELEKVLSQEDEGEKENTSDSDTGRFADLRSKLKSRMTEMAKHHKSQEAALEAIRAYLNRKSEIQLVFEGIIEGTAEELPVLDSFLKDVAGPKLLEYVSKFEEKVIDTRGAIEKELATSLSKLTEASKTETSTATANFKEGK